MVPGSGPAMTPPPSSTAEQRGDCSHLQDIPTRGWEQPDGNHSHPAPPGSDTHLAGGCFLPYLESAGDRRRDTVTARSPAPKHNTLPQLWKQIRCHAQPSCSWADTEKWDRSRHKSPRPWPRTPKGEPSS